VHGRKDHSPRITRRGLMLLGIQFGVIGTLGWRMRQLQVEQSDQYRLLAEENRINIRLIAPERGQIFDSRGVLVARNQPNYRIVMVREQAENVEQVLDRLARLINLSDADKRDVLEDMYKRSPFLPVTVKQHMSWEEFALVAANGPSLPGVITDVGLNRNYPFNETYAHLVGYVGPVSERDLSRMEDPDPLFQIPRFPIGKTGVERTLENTLRGSAGIRRIEVNATGRVMRELGRDEATPGKDVQLTVETGLQEYARKRLAGESAAAVVMDVNTGDIKAMASAPGFNPNSFVLGISNAEWEPLRDSKYRPLSDKSVSGAYPPGSTFKMAVALAALEEGLLEPDETIVCRGFIELGGRRFHCWKRGGHGRVDLDKSLEQSCDVYYYEIARRVGIEKIAAMARRLGMGQEFDIPLSAMSSGLIPDKAYKLRLFGEKWKIGDTLNAGIGQGFVLASPIQLAVMTARLATGRAVLPNLVYSLDGVPARRTEAPDLGISASALDYVREGMYSVVNSEQGTARKSRIADRNNLMAGKTGTSQVRGITMAQREAGLPDKDEVPWENRDHALFVCYAPYDKPKYAVAVVVEHGDSGSGTAAPIARDIMMRALYDGEPPLAAYPPAERNRIRAEQERARAAELATQQNGEGQ